MMSTGPLETYLLPDTAKVGERGELRIGGVSMLDIAAEFGTPAFVYDEQHLVNRCREAVEAFPQGVAYASKAFSCKQMIRIAADAGMRIDVASGGEMHVALAAGARPADLVLHGNNKSVSELRFAVESGVGLIVIDSFDEIDRIESMNLDRSVSVLLRVTPGIEAHTHEYVMTGHEDSKFGLSLSSGAAQSAVDRMLASSAFDVVGAHAHVGSLVFDTDPYAKAVELLVPFVVRNELRELCIGGGLGVPYVAGEHADTLPDWGNTIAKAVEQSDLPDDVIVTAEPGRSIVASSAVTLYTVGTIKELPGIRTYVSVDGGMSDNPRPVLYGSGYEVFLPRAVDAPRPKQITMMGKHCESGDFLVKDAQVPDDLSIGDIIATPVTGAYGYSMASTYNRVPRPPIVFVKDGHARLVVRRETYEDLLLLDL